MHATIRNSIGRRSTGIFALHAIIRPFGALLLFWAALGTARPGFGQPGLGLPGPGQPARVTVADVIPQGLYNVPPEKVMRMIKTRPGAEYQPFQAEQDVRTLFESKLFANVKVSTVKVGDDKVNVHFLLVEYPSRVQDIVFNGAKHVSQKELENVTGLHKDMPLNPTFNQMARQSILRKYNELGRIFAGVELVEGGKPGDTRVVFNITEGQVVKVNDIEFTGVDFVPVGRLRTQLQSSKAILHFIGGQYNPALADLDVGKIEEYYKTFGYLDVHVAREVQFDEDNAHVKLIFHVKEGERYKVGEVSVVGSKSKSPDKLLALKEMQRIKPGAIFDGNLVRAGGEAMAAEFGYDGKQVSPNAKEIFDTSHPGEVRVVYEIQEQPVARVGNILIVGNDTTRDNVILRQIPIFPGQILPYPDLRLAERNLAKLGIFEADPEKGGRPTLTVLENDNSEYKDILVQVKEMPTGSLLFGLGVNSDAGLTGSIVLNERNFDITRPPTSFDDLLSGHAFRGAGQEFRIEAVPGTQVQRYTASFREPFLFDSPWSLGVSGYYYDRVYTEDTEGRVGGRVTLGRKLTDQLTASVGLRVENVNISNVYAFEPPDYTSVVGDNFLVGLRGDLTWDTRDSYLRATEGHLIDASFEEVTGAYTFPLINIEANKFWTVYQRADGSGRHVLAARSQLSYAGSNTPVYERYFAGGFRSLRGFEFRGVSPEVNGFKVGGDFMFLNSLEYQIPILANDQLYAVGFVDSGTVESSVEIRNYRVTAGFGLRIVVPMLGPVPIALDFGFPIVQAPTDNKQVFSFWVGFFH